MPEVCKENTTTKSESTLSQTNLDKGALNHLPFQILQLLALLIKHLLGEIIHPVWTFRVDVEGVVLHSLDRQYQG